jgi:hypothetical protein
MNNHISGLYEEMAEYAAAGRTMKADSIWKEIQAAERQDAEEMPSRSAKDLKWEVASLERQVANAVRRGDHSSRQAAQASLDATNLALGAAETRERQVANAARRLKADRKQAGLDEDGSLQSAGYDSPGALIADRIRRGPVVVGIESYLRQAGIKPSDRP